MPGPGQGAPLPSGAVEPTARNPKPARSTLRRYLPFVAAIVVIAVVIAVVNLAGGGKDKKSSTPATGVGPPANSRTPRRA